MKKQILVFPFVIIFFMPLFFLILQIINGIYENPKALEYFITNQFFSKFYNSFILSFGVSFASVCFALFSSFAFFSFNQLWQRHIFILLHLVLFSISPIIYLTSLTKLTWFSQLSVYAQSLSVLSLQLSPLSTIIFIFYFSRFNILSIKTAMMITTLRNTLKYIIIPQLYKPIISVFIILFMLTFIQEEVPSFLGYRTYAEEFLSRIVIMENIKEISFMTIPFVLMSFGTLIVLVNMVQNQVEFTNSLSCILFKYKNYSLFIFILLSLLVISLSLLLIIELINVDILELFIDNINSLKNSFLLSFFVGILGTVIAIIIYPYICKKSSKYIKILQIFPLLVYWLMPSSLSSLSLIELSIYLNEYNISIGYTLIIFAYLIKTLPIAIILLFIFSIGQSTVPFFKLYDVKTIFFFKYITIPLEWTKWFLITIILTIFSLNELSSTILLIPPGEETIIVKMYNLMHYGDFSSVAFLSLLQMCLILLLISAIGLLLRIKYDFTK